jgi:cobalamin biosynthesis protein CobC
LLEHGGDLTRARRLFPGAPEPLIDLSTGINPFAYPVPSLAAAEFVRLPDRAGIRALAALVAQWYGAPSAECVVPAPGTQILFPMVAGLVPPGRAVVLGPTYAEHVRVAALAGHDVREAKQTDELKDASLAIVVNPNNPDGRITSRETLLGLAAALQSRGGILVIDEAFADVAPGVGLAGEVGRGNIVVLRSFGKFFGLAGLRLGFALAAPQLAQRLDAVLGPWAISGPAVAIASEALADKSWRDRTLKALEQAAQRLDRVLIGAGLKIVGGTSLFRLTQSTDAGALFERLGRQGIVVRRFDEHPAWLRWGIPADEMAWQRLGAALK